MREVVLICVEPLRYPEGCDVERLRVKRERSLTNGWRGRAEHVKQPRLLLTETYRRQ
jgi:hypothetical protein